jgi:hypothetical protein
MVVETVLYLFRGTVGMVYGVVEKSSAEVCNSWRSRPQCSVYCSVLIEEKEENIIEAGNNP